MKAYLSLIKYALANGATLTVDDGMEEINCTGYESAKDAIEAVDESDLYIFVNGERVGWAFIIPELAPDESVSDYSDNPFMNAWEQTYYD